MATRTFPPQIVFRPQAAGSALLGATGTMATVYRDAALSTVESTLLLADGTPVSGGRVLVDASSRTPRLRLDATSPLTVLYALPDGGTVATPLFADAEELLASADARYPQVVAVSTPTAAGLTAALAACPVDGAVYLPSGMNVVLASAVTVTDRGLLCAPGSKVTVPTALGSGVAALTFQNSSSGNTQVVENLTLAGSYARTLGVRGGVGDGVKITGQGKVLFRRPNLQGFDAGAVLANAVGHIYFDDPNITNNYYGIYQTLNNSDYHVRKGDVNGNTFANFACTAGEGFASMVVESTHIGFAPYAFYQEATPAAQGSNRVFMQEVTLRNARFEAIGNAAIFSDATDTSTNFSGFQDVIIENPGFSYAPDYRLSGRARSYTIKVGTTARNIQIIDGPSPFTAGDTGLFYANTSNHNSWTRQTSSPATGSLADLTVGSGRKSYYLQSRPGDNAARFYGVGSYYGPAAARTTGTRPNNYMTCVPFYVERPVNVDALAVAVTAAGSTGAVLRLGIYDDVNGFPGNLIVDAGTTAADVTGVRAITGLTVSLKQGWYYLAAVAQNAATTQPTCRVFGAGTVLPGMQILASDLNSGSAFANGSVSGALPASASAASITDTGYAVAWRGGAL